MDSDSEGKGIWIYSQARVLTNLRVGKLIRINFFETPSWIISISFSFDTQVTYICSVVHLKKSVFKLFLQQLGFFFFFFKPFSSEESNHVLAKIKINKQRFVI